MKNLNAKLMLAIDISREYTTPKRTIQELAQRGALPSTRLSSGVRVFLRKDVERFFAERRMVAK